MPVSDPLVIPLALDMLACLQQEIAKVETPPQYVQMRTGDVVAHLLSMAQDECCQGLAWVRPADFYPASEFPQQDETARSTGVTSWAVTLELGAIRCAPTPEPDAIPTADQWMAVSIAVMDDAAAMRRAICCFIESQSSPGRNWKSRVIPGRWQPIPMEGGCVGGVLPVTIMGPACDCAEAGPES